MENHFLFQASKLGPAKRRLSFCDRFIPYRSALNIEYAQSEMAKQPDEVVCAQENEEYMKMLNKALNANIERILPVSPPKRNPDIFEKYSPPWCVASRDNYYQSPTKTHRRAAISSPERILDMPGLRDDFYTNVLDWSSSNQIAVALHNKTFVWDVATKKCRKIEADFGSDEEVFVSSLSWNESGSTLAMGTSEGEILLWDTEQRKLMRSYSQSDKGQAGVLAWNRDSFCSGSSKGSIFSFDHRTPGCTYVLTGHRGDVCGLKFSPHRQYLASGGDDGTVALWAGHGYKSTTVITAHQACAKAIAWCPWRANVIASGGGSHDGHIRLWHIHTKDTIAETNTGSQICGLLWSDDYKELVSSHGTHNTENNDIILWKVSDNHFHSPQCQGRLRLHKRRPLHMALSPDKTTIASAGADETLCLWKCFPEAGKPKKGARGLKPSQLHLDRYIR